ncbi:hypothetical protein MLD38_000792 [Melastoma candidum]|uniref:Uncharacterized protein n=1 Tax=Melastoma candidum TaxID=119954 RepID=A0ACB9SAQ2_9MYRT|nr:hypothetical protein MLD38_000792 [Melastoma candidum]
MGRSTSCFKIMACGGGDPSEDNNDQLDVPEVKSDRRRWSFHKRSARHRVLSNSVLSESPVENKEIPECVNVDTKATTDFDDVEKVSTIPCAVEKPQLSAPPEVKTPETVVETKLDIIEDEASIVIIQAGIRAYMAQKELLKLRKVIKVQALVRGHLVRRHAVGTLRCVQAIVKMQALVRTRYASRLVEGSSTEKNPEPREMEKETHIAMERLLNNRFAQQILESKPRKKPIHIKCDASKTDSAWQWLERWMSVTSSKQSSSMEASNEERVSEIKEEIALDEGMALTSEVVRTQPMSSHGDTDSVIADGGADMSASAVKDPEVIPLQPMSSHGDTTDSVTADGGGDTASAMKEPKIDETPDVDGSIVLQETENPITSSEITTAEPDDAIVVGVESEGDIEQPRHSEKSVAHDQLVTDLREPSIESGIVNDPEFTVALSKFEEMTPDTTSSDPVISSYEDVVPVAEEVDRTTDVLAEIQFKDNSVSDKLLAHTGGSECGTELSISSTLDSPDRDEHAEKGNQSQFPYDEASKTDGVEHLEDEVNTDHPKEGVDPVSKVDNAVVAEETVEAGEHEIGKPTPDLDTEVTAEATPRHNLPSPGTSPRSLMTVPESQGTPASQASVNTKGSVAIKSILSHKRKSFSAGKRSPSSPKQESASSNSKESPRERKLTRRRALKPEDAEQEPRVSNSNSTGSIPHFMQATESARAKLNANNSPRSSPDVHDRDLTTKKKHSPHARQHSGKANGTQPQERKWIR